MNYTRGNDIVSALKFFYQNKYGVPTEILAECRSIPEVICASEKLQILQSDSGIISGSSVDVINALGSYYAQKKIAPSELSKLNKSSKKESKHERSEETKEQVEKPVEVKNSLVDPEIKMEEDHA